MKLCDIQEARPCKIASTLSARSLESSTGITLSNRQNQELDFRYAKISPRARVHRALDPHHESRTWASNCYMRLSKLAWSMLQFHRRSGQSQIKSIAMHAKRNRLTGKLDLSNGIYAILSDCISNRHRLKMRLSRWPLVRAFSLCCVRICSKSSNLNLCLASIGIWRPHYEC